MNQSKTASVTNLDAFRTVLSALFVVSFAVLVMVAPIARVSAWGDDGGDMAEPDWGSAVTGGFGDIASEPDWGSAETSGLQDANTGCGDVCDPNSANFDPCACADFNNDGIPDDQEPTYFEEGGQSFGGGSTSGGSSGGGGFSMPRFGGASTPVTTFFAPTYTAPHQQQYQQQQQHQSQTSTSNTSNYCTNNSCNTHITDNSITQIDNSINNSNVGTAGTAVVYPVQSAPVAYPVSYVQPIVANPSCTITINRYNNGAYGQYSNQLATLTWTSTNATSGFVNPGVGSVSTYGSMTVYPVNGQVYSLTVYGPGGTATCATPAQYAPVLAAPVPATPYVSLSQIPYTGLDMSPLAQAMYWMGLVAFAGAAAYLVLYFQGGAANVLASVTGSRAARTQVTAPRAQMPALRSLGEVGPVVSPIQVAAVASTRTTSTDTMRVIESKSGAAPRIIITRS